MNVVRPSIPNFRITEYCGSGGSSDVWVGVDKDGIARAIKVMDAAQEAKAASIEHEIQSIADYRKLVGRHPHLLDIFFLGTTGKCRYYVCELADNAARGNNLTKYTPDTLEHRIRHSKFSEREQLDTVLALTETIVHLHGCGLGHRDLKPANILYVGGVLKIGDPGLVCRLDSAASTSGTADFKPPWKSSSAECDIYAIGKILYCLYSGKNASEYPSLPPGTDFRKIKPFNTVARRCCSADVRDRYASASELLADLRSLRRPTLGERLRASRHRIGYGVLAAVLAVSAGLNIYGVCRHSDLTMPRGEAELRIAAARQAFDRHEVVHAHRMLREVVERYPDYRNLDGFAAFYGIVSQIYFWQRSFGVDEALATDFYLLHDEIGVIGLPERRALYENIFTIDPATRRMIPLQYYYVKILDRLGDQAAVRREVERALTLPVDPGREYVSQLYLMRFATFLMDRGDLDGALVFMDRACGIQTSNDVAYLMRARIRILRKEYQNALSDIRCVRREGHNGEIVMTLLAEIPENERKR